MQAYLTFNGNAAEALAFYAKALGGKVVFSMSFGESPMGAETPAAYKDKIMHATLEARGHQLMASDMPPGMPFEGTRAFRCRFRAAAWTRERSSSTRWPKAARSRCCSARSSGPRASAC